MPEYFVEFSGVVIYQPDHPKVARPITGLCVNAASPNSALQHAIRTTRGDAEVSVVLLTEADPAKVDAARTLLPYTPPVPIVPAPVAEYVAEAPAG